MIPRTRLTFLLLIIATSTTAFAWKSADGLKYDSLTQCLNANRGLYCIDEKFTSNKEFFIMNPTFKQVEKLKALGGIDTSTEKGWACLEGGGKITPGKCGSGIKGITFYQFS